jgi:cellulose synthase/poly-beta-1,6-N-acetylglucosamine synthase-like glycosyltransferase
MLDQFMTFLFGLLAAVHMLALGIFLFPSRKAKSKKYCPPVSIIIPAHNEEKFIANTIESLVNAKYNNKREIIVIDDGSSDNTAEIVNDITKKNKNIRLFSIPHSGKSKALNYGVKKAQFDTVVYLDADSSIVEKSLMNLVQPLSDPNIAASTGVIRAKYSGIFSWFQDIDWLISSCWRYVFGKLNSLHVAGGFAAFKKTALENVNGFSTDTLTEDIEITIRLRKAGFRVAMTDAVMFTSVPSSIRGFVKQRMRWARGLLQTTNKHSDIIFHPNKHFFGMYPMHQQLFWYVFGVVYTPFALYWFFSNLATQAISFNLILFMAKWFTLYGIMDMLYGIMVASYALTALRLMIILSWAFSLAYIIAAMSKFGYTWRMVVAYAFVFPYYWLIMFVQALVAVSAIFSRTQVQNKWSKSMGN